MTLTRRRSARLRALAALESPLDHDEKQPTKRKTKDATERKKPSITRAKASSSIKTKTTSKRNAVNNNNNNNKTMACLPRTREQELLLSDDLAYVLGVDEAGRGPLAGPVVAAAAIVPEDVPGIVDSKKLTKEEVRDELYEKLLGSVGIQWAVAVVDAQTIDDINILQASLKAMEMAVGALVDPDATIEKKEALAEHSGCYVVKGQKESPKGRNYYALIDGNKVPKNLPCSGEAMVKGDGREYAIGAASIIAKVTRDRLMKEYDAMYPQYELSKHKGYPTAAHRNLIQEHGASPIHRRTFAPLKHMKFDKDGKILDQEEAQ